MNLYKIYGNLIDRKFSRNLSIREKNLLEKIEKRLDKDEETFYNTMIEKFKYLIPTAFKGNKNGKA